MTTYDNDQQDSAAVSRIKDEAASLLESAKEKLSDVAEPIRDKALEAVEQQKGKHAQQIDTIARAVDSAAQELESELPGIAGYIHDGAQSLGKVAVQVRDRNLEQLAGDVVDFARRNPALAFGGFVLAGFTLARFLKSSSQQQTASGDGRENGYGNGYGAGSEGGDDEYARQTGTRSQYQGA